MSTTKTGNFFFQHNINHFKSGEYSRYLSKNGISGLGFINQINSYLTEYSNEGSFYHFVECSFDLTPHNAKDSLETERAYWLQFFKGCPDLEFEGTEDGDFSFGSTYVETEVLAKKKESSRFGKKGNIKKAMLYNKFDAAQKQLEAIGYRITAQELEMIKLKTANRSELNKESQRTYDFLTNTKRR